MTRVLRVSSLPLILLSLWLFGCVQSFAPLPLARLVRSSATSSLTPTMAARTPNTQLKSILQDEDDELEHNFPYKKVFIAGGTKGVGRCLVEKLQSVDIPVVVMARTQEAVDELNAMEGVTGVLGDALDQKSVENAMDGCDAVVSTLGGTGEDRRVDYQGNCNVIESAGILGIQRLILLTSIGCGSSKEATPPAVFEALKGALEAKEKAENLLIKYYTNTLWTINRPGGLLSGPGTEVACLTEDVTAIGTIHREDLATLIVRTLAAKETPIQKVLSAVDPSISDRVTTSGEPILPFRLW